MRKACVIVGAFLVGAAIAVAVWPPPAPRRELPSPPPLRDAAEEARERLEAGDLEGAERAAVRDPGSAETIG